MTVPIETLDEEGRYHSDGIMPSYNNKGSGVKRWHDHGLWHRESGCFYSYENFPLMWGLNEEILSGRILLW